MKRQLQKVGNSKGLILNRTMLDHLGLTGDSEVEVTLEEGRIIVTAPELTVRRQTFEEAANSIFTQYAPALQRLADN